MSGPPPPPVISSIAFLGTPVEAAHTLGALDDAGFDVPLVITRPDRRRGRGGATSPSPVKEVALERGLTVSHDLDDLGTAGVDLAVVVAYGRIIPAALIEQVPLVNIHFSLLPRWRGAAPVERALLAGDTETGVCLMAVDETLDTGAVYARAAMSIGPEVSASALRARLTDLGTDLLIDTMKNGFGAPEPQRGEPTYAAKIEPNELEIDWTRSAVEIDRLVRVGGAHTTFRGRRFKVWEARPLDRPAGPPGELAGVTVGTGHGSLALVTVQPDGKGRMDADAWANGARPDGCVLGA